MSNTTRGTLISAHVAARALAALQIVQKHVGLSQAIDRRFRVAAEASADGVGDDPKALAELVNEAEGEIAVNDGGSDEKHPGDFRGLVLVCQ